MNHELFSNMQKQMTPSPETRAALSETLARPLKKRPVPWMKYGVVAACAALVVTMCGAAVMSDQDKWNALVSRFMQDHPNAVYNGDNPHDSWFIVDPSGSNQPLHSYVMVEGVTGIYTENVAVSDKGGGDHENYSTGVVDRDGDTYAGDILDHTQAPNTGDLPANTYLEWEQKSLAQQEAVNAYQKLMGHFALGYPDWYGGAYIDDDNNLMVLLVSDKDAGDKSLELKVLRWTGSDKVIFGSAKYSLGYLRSLQDKVCDTMVELGLLSSCGANESENRLELTLIDVTDEALALLAELDPDDDAIYVQVGQRASHDLGGEVVTADSAKTEDPAVRHVMPGGVTVPVPDDEDLIAIEPYYDGADYDLEHLPEELPEQKQPAFQVDSAPEEDTSSCDPNA